MLHVSARALAGHALSIFGDHQASRAAAALPICCARALQPAHPAHPALLIEKQLGIHEDAGSASVGFTLSPPMPPS